MNKIFSIGDPIEVRFATHDGYIWNLAHVVSVNHSHIFVATADNRRVPIFRGSGDYRRPQEAKP